MEKSEHEAGDEAQEPENVAHGADIEADPPTPTEALPAPPSSSSAVDDVGDQPDDPAHGAPREAPGDPVLGAPPELPDEPVLGEPPEMAIPDLGLGRLTPRFPLIDNQGPQFVGFTTRCATNVNAWFIDEVRLTDLSGVDRVTARWEPDDPSHPVLHVLHYARISSDEFDGWWRTIVPAKAHEGWLWREAVDVRGNQQRSGSHRGASSPTCP